MKIRDSEGDIVYQATRKECDGTWSANVWKLHDTEQSMAIEVVRYYGYATRSKARNSHFYQEDHKNIPKPMPKEAESEVQPEAEAQAS